MRTIETTANVVPGGTLTVQVPSDIPPGTYAVVLTFLDAPAVVEQHDFADFPVDNIGPWPEGLSLRREDMYGDKVRVIHDAVGHTLTVWIGDPMQEYVCEETAEELVVMKDASGRVIGFELLHYRPSETSELGLAVETVVRGEA